MKNKLKPINKINYNPTEPKENIGQKTNNELKEVFTITEVNPNSEKWEKMSYNMLQNIYQKIYNLNDKASHKEVVSLLKDYIEIYKNSSKNIQDLFNWRLEKLLNHKKMWFIVKQIEQDWWIIKFWERRFDIK